MNSVRLHAPSQVAGELAESAQRGASGVSQIGGDPGGTIYLSEGYLDFAESAAVPDLGSGVVDSRRPGAEQWSRADPGLLRQILTELRRLD